MFKTTDFNTLYKLYDKSCLRHAKFRFQDYRMDFLSAKAIYFGQTWHIYFTKCAFFSITASTFGYQVLVNAGKVVYLYYF